MDPGTVVSAISCIAEYTVAPIVKQVKYVLNYKQNLTNLPREVEKLRDLKREIEGLVSSARGNAEDIKPSVEAWMKEADVAADRIIQEEEHSKNMCFIGLCPNPVSRHCSSRKAFKETVQILRLNKAGEEFKNGSVSFPVSAVPSFPVRPTLDKDFLDFSSRSRTWEEIINALKDPDVNVIGVYGMGGLGKTTLVNQVVTRAVEEGLYDVVVPVVTQKNVLDVKEFQEEMARVLNMKLDDQWNQWNVNQRAHLIFKRLMQQEECDEKMKKKTIDEKIEKNTIVILDDLRAKLNLEQVGIPFGAGIKGCKILFTSRFQYISYAAQKTITLGILKEEEAWTLFQKLAGDVLKDRDFFDIGKEVTENCKGLPILIVTVAGALLQRRSLGAWKDALTNLKQEGSKEIQEFVDSALEFISFNHLPPANKSLFLLCGLFGGGEISIFDQLLKLGIGWGLFKHTRRVEEARNNLETLIHDLKASFLLLDGQSIGSVRMHDVVRDVAIKIASKEGHNMLVVSSKEWPEDDELNGCTALTFPYGIVPPLPKHLVSPSLEFLLLYHNHSSLEVTDTLFEKMQKLTVLDIRFVDLFPKLPSSLSFLENLHTLSLNRCKLKDISIVGALKKLQILSINNTSIVVLPVVIGELSKLRILDLNGCSELKVIPPDVIKRLSRLEELHMAKSFSQWEVDQGLPTKERRNASIDELNYLVNLTTLIVHIPDANLLPKDFYFQKLKRFTILIGDEKWDWSCHNDKSLYTLRGIKIKINGSRDIYLEAGVQEMLKRAEILYLDGMKNIHELEWKRFQELKFVHIRHSAETPYILNVMESFPAGPESLSLSKLKYVDVNNCNNLRNLFSFSMARGLPHLEQVKVTDCYSLEAVVEDTREECSNGDTVMNKLEFCQLRSLSLKRLPKLASFCNNVTNSSADGCTIAAPFFSEKVLFPNLEKLELEECHCMEYLFNQSIVVGLEQLRFITIDNCKSLKGIVAHVEGEETNETIEFPQLINLVLRGLPCLTRFSSGCSTAFPTLTRLYISACWHLKAFAWADTISEDKTMTNNKFSTSIQPLFNEKVLFPKLEELTLNECGSMEYLFYQSIIMGSEQLNSIRIENCRSLRGIVAKVDGEEAKETIKFPQLVNLILVELPCLTRFCSGCAAVFPTLTRLSIRECRQLKTFACTDTVREDKTMTSLFNEKVELPNLKTLELLWMDNVETIWHNRLHEDSFFKLEQVEISSCPNLLKIFPCTMLRRIRNLEKLRLENNCFVEEVFENDGMTKPNILQGGETTEEKIKFSQLRCLQLMNLSNLKRFCSGSCVAFPALTELEISCCEQIETFMYPIGVSNGTRKGVEDMDSNDMQPLFNEKVEFPSLVELDLRHLDSIKIIWASRIHKNSFSTLEELTIWNCANLLRIFPLAMTGRIHNGCQEIKEIVQEDEIVFSKLKTLELVGLPTLTNFYLGNCILKFPLLEEVTVTECFNMKAFCGGITTSPKLKTVYLTRKEMDYERDEWPEEEKDLNTIIKVGKTGVVFELGKKSEISTVRKKHRKFKPVVKQERRAKTCEDAVKCREEVAGMINKATNSSVKAECSKKAIQSKKNDGICEEIIEPRKEVHTYEYDKAMEPNDNEAINSRNEAYKVDDDLRKQGEFCEEIVEPREDIDSCKEIAQARNEAETLSRPYLVKETQGSPTTDTVDVTCPSSHTLPAIGSGIGATICQQNDDFQGLQVTQHLVQLLEKARDKHGDFHTNPLIKSKTMRIAAMESVGQVLHILQTQPPRSIDAEKIQFMEDAFHDLSLMSFHIEWLRPLIDKAKKCLFCLEKEAKIDEMEVQLQLLKRELEMEKALIDLNRPLLDI